MTVVGGMHVYMLLIQQYGGWVAVGLGPFQLKWVSACPQYFLTELNVNIEQNPRVVQMYDPSTEIG